MTLIRIAVVADEFYLIVCVAVVQEGRDVRACHDTDVKAFYDEGIW